MKYGRCTSEANAAAEGMQAAERDCDAHRVNWRERALAAEAELALTRGAMQADDERLRVAAERVDLQFGCDSPEHMADAILSLRAKLSEVHAIATRFILDPEGWDCARNVLDALNAGQEVARLRGEVR